jgi:hypothetical protein
MSLNNPTWKILWKLKVPVKVKIFCWRVLHGILPLKDILVKRHVGTDPQCPLCSSAPEDSLHMIFKCQGAMNIWRILGLDNLIMDACIDDRSGAAVLQVLL